MINETVLKMIMPMLGIKKEDGDILLSKINNMIKEVDKIKPEDIIRMKLLLETEYFEYKVMQKEISIICGFIEKNLQSNNKLN